MSGRWNNLRNMSALYYILCMSLLLSCESKKNTETKGTETSVTAKETGAADNIKYVNGITITSPEKKSAFRYNDQITLTFSSKERFPVDSAELTLNGKKLAGVQGTAPFKFQLPDTWTGNVTLKITAYHPDNKRSVATLPILIKPDKAPQKYSYGIVKVYPHDIKAYTQGLVYHDGFIYEGTGQYGESGIRKYDMSSGKILSALNIDGKLFGEGITIWQDKIYQLTWTSGKGFIYDLKTFTPESTFRYNTQGWGLTTMGDKLIMSDGSNKLYHVDPASFGILKTVEVYDNNGPVINLNELEYINGKIWANVWLSDRIVIIDPERGEVTAELDMSKLLPVPDRNKLDDSDDVLNGIAWNPGNGHIYLTGKRWPKMFEVNIKE